MRTLWFVALAIAIAAPAYAEHPKYTRKQNVVIDVKLSSRVTPKQPAEAPKPEPTLTPDDILRIQDEAQPLRREQEAILEKLIKDTPDDDPDKPDFMFRLAEHYAQQLRHYRLEAIAPTIPAHPR